MRAACASLLLTLALIWSHVVLAHAVLEGTHPADGVAVPQAPEIITLDFSEAVSPIFARVLDRHGKAVTAPSDVSSVDKQLRIRVANPLPDGSYMVTYRVLSADTHPVGGAFPFVVGAGSGSAADTDANRPTDSNAKAMSEATWLRLIIFNRALHLNAMMLVAGAALYLLLIEGRAKSSCRTLSRLEVPLAAVGVITAVIAVGLQGALMAETPLNGIFTEGAAALWGLGALTTRGASTLLAVIGLLLITAGFRKRESKAAPAILTAGVLACMASLVVAGHAATLVPRLAVLPAWIIHGAVAAFWIGSLTPLLCRVLPFIAEPNASALGNEYATHAVRAEVLRRFGAFSRMALPGVLTMLAAGLLLAFLQCGTDVIAAFDISSRYALVLVIKVALVCLLLGLAALNRFKLVPRLALNTSDAAARRALRNSLIVELLVGVSVIAAAAVLSQQPPPATLGHAVGAAPASNRALPAVVIEQSLTSTKGHRARLRITRQPDGNMQLAVQMSNARSEVLSPIAVNLELSNSDAGIESLQRKFAPASDGSRDFRYSGRDFVVPGLWSVRIDAVITDFEQSSFITTVNIAPR